MILQKKNIIFSQIKIFLRLCNTVLIDAQKILVVVLNAVTAFDKLT